METKNESKEELMNRIPIHGYLNELNNRKLIIELYLTKEERDTFVIEKGVVPKRIIKEVRVEEVRE